MLKFVTLYVALVLTSAIVITVALQTNPLAAVATASVGCIFKTVAASAHGWAWQRWGKVKAKGCECVKA